MCKKALLYHSVFWKLFVIFLLQIFYSRIAFIYSVKRNIIIWKWVVFFTFSALIQADTIENEQQENPYKQWP